MSPSPEADDKVETPFSEADRTKAIALMQGRFGNDTLLPLVLLTLPVMSSQGVVLYRVERWNKTSGKYVGWRRLADGSIRINEFPPGSHELLQVDRVPVVASKPEQPGLEEYAEILKALDKPLSDDDQTFLRVLGFNQEELPNNERLAPYVDQEDLP